MLRQFIASVISLTSALAGLLVLVPSEAHAYIDPGFGSLAFQGLLAAFAAVSAVGAWVKLKAKGLMNRHEKSERPPRGHH